MSEDKIKDRLASLQALNNLANDMDDYTDAAANLEIDEFEASFGDFGMPDFGGMGMPGGMPGFGGMGMPGGMPGFGGPVAPGGKPRDVAFYETIIVHGLRGDYELSFNETDDGLEIIVKK